MINNISLLNNQWLWQTILIAVFIWLVFIWKERNKLNKKSFYLNCIVSFIALISLVCIVLKPVFKASTIKSSKIAILTNSYQKKQLDSLKRIHKKIKIYNYIENKTIIPKDKNPETVYVLGNGLQDYDLWQLDSVPTIYIEGKLPQGINQFKYKSENIVGNDLVFKGQYLQPKKGFKLHLENPSGQILDSINLINNDVQDFQLTTNLKAKGEFVYYLVEKDSINTIINKEPLPIIIKEQKFFKILIVNEFPSFETKYLKNYLAEAGHELVIRSKLTKDRFKYEYFNVENKPKINFTQDQLKNYDLIIIDAYSLNSLSNKRKNALKNSINKDGLGLFIQAEENFFKKRKSWYSFNFTANTVDKITLDGYKKTILYKFPFIFNNDINIEPILESNSKTISAYKRLGVGRIATNVLKNTYELQLNGNSKTYNEIWAKTIQSVSKKEIPNVEWFSNSPIIFLNEPFNFKVRTTVKNPKIFAGKDYQISMKRDINIKSLWKGTTYPTKTGWNTLTMLQDSTKVFKFYVTNNKQWKTLRAFKNLKANKKYFNSKKNDLVKTIKSNKIINPLWFFIIFLISVGYLWLKPRL